METESEDWVMLTNVELGNNEGNCVLTGTVDGSCLESRHGPVVSMLSGEILRMFVWRVNGV